MNKKIVNNHKDMLKKVFLDTIVLIFIVNIIIFILFHLIGILLPFGNPNAINPLLEKSSLFNIPFYQAPIFMIYSYAYETLKKKIHKYIFIILIFLISLTNTLTPFLCFIGPFSFDKNGFIFEFDKNFVLSFFVFPLAPVFIYYLIWEIINNENKLRNFIILSILLSFSVQIKCYAFAPLTHMSLCYDATINMSDEKSRKTFINACTIPDTISFLFNAENEGKVLNHALDYAHNLNSCDNKVLSIQNDYNEKGKPLFGTEMIRSLYQETLYYDTINSPFKRIRFAKSDDKQFAYGWLSHQIGDKYAHGLDGFALSINPNKKYTTLLRFHPRYAAMQLSNMFIHQFNEIVGDAIIFDLSIYNTQEYEYLEPKKMYYNPTLLSQASLNYYSNIRINQKKAISFDQTIPSFRKTPIDTRYNPETDRAEYVYFYANDLINDWFKYEDNKYKPPKEVSIKSKLLFALMPTSFVLAKEFIKIKGFIKIKNDYNNIFISKYTYAINEINDSLNYWSIHPKSNETVQYAIDNYFKPGCEYKRSMIEKYEYNDSFLPRFYTLLLQNVDPNKLPDVTKATDLGDMNMTGDNGFTLSSNTYNKVEFENAVINAIPKLLNYDDENVKMISKFYYDIINHPELTIDQIIERAAAFIVLPTPIIEKASFSNHSCKVVMKWNPNSSSEYGNVAGYNIYIATGDNEFSAEPTIKQPYPYFVADLNGNQGVFKYAVSTIYGNGNENIYESQKTEISNPINLTDKCVAKTVGTEVMPDALVWRPIGISAGINETIDTVMEYRPAFRLETNYQKSATGTPMFASSVLFSTDTEKADFPGQCLIDEPRPGTAYWTYSQYGFATQVNIFGSEIAADAAYGVQLDYGWNMISNPYTKTSMKWPDNLKVNVNGIRYENISDYISNIYRFEYETATATLQDINDFLSSASDAMDNPLIVKNTIYLGVEPLKDGLELTYSTNSTSISNAWDTLSIGTFKVILPRIMGEKESFTTSSIFVRKIDEPAEAPMTLEAAMNGYVRLVRRSGKYTLLLDSHKFILAYPPKFL